MRIIFVIHPCNRSKVQQKIAEYESKNHEFKQVLIVEKPWISLEIIYMKYFAKDEVTSFKLKNGIKS